MLVHLFTKPNFEKFLLKSDFKSIFRLKASDKCRISL